MSCPSVSPRGCSPRRPMRPCAGTAAESVGCAQTWREQSHPTPTSTISRELPCGPTPATGWRSSGCRTCRANGSSRACAWWRNRGYGRHWRPAAAPSRRCRTWETGSMPARGSPRTGNRSRQLPSGWNRHPCSTGSYGSAPRSAWRSSRSPVVSGHPLTCWRIACSPAARCACWPTVTCPRTGCRSPSSERRPRCRRGRPRSRCGPGRRCCLPRCGSIRTAGVCVFTRLCRIPT